jgi:hypothetical protein
MFVNNLVLLAIAPLTSIFPRDGSQLNCIRKRPNPFFSLAEYFNQNKYLVVRGNYEG